MCGFVAIFKNPEDNSGLSLSKELLSHRGPDDQTIHSDENYILGFWRLSIVDIARGRQPMEDKNLGIKLLFNGEIYNYKKIKEELLKREHNFKSESDTEVILKAYIEWGLDCFKKFEGMFSICIIDSKKSKIFLARDQMGVKPIYYAYSGDDLLIASEQKAILKTANINPKINQKSLQDYFLYQTILGRETLFQDIYKVKEGEVLSFDLKNRKLLNSHKIEPLSLDIELKSYDDYQFFIKNQILNETIDALDTDLDLTFQLSGGIDSNMIMSIANKYFPDKKKYSVSSTIKDNFDDDELSFIRQSVNYFKTEHKIIEIDSNKFFSYLDDAIEYLDEPAGDAGVVAQFIVNEKISEFSKIGIAGQGADELFFGYMRNYLTYIVSTQNHDLLDSKFFEGWENYLKGFNKFGDSDPKYSYFNKMKRFQIFEECEDDIKDFDKKLLDKMTSDFKRIAQNSDSLNHFMVNTEIELQLQALLQMEDRSSMKYSVETRVPLCTSSILSASKLGSIDWKFKGNLPKGILRDAFSDLIPEHILNRHKKVGRPIPLKSWLNNNKKGSDYLNLLRENKEFINSLFNINLHDYALNHPNIYDRTTWAILSIVLWSKKYNVSF